MTAWRRQRKLTAAGLGAVLLAAAAITGAVSLGAATTEQLVVDRYTGLAINGYDPVAYFVEGSAVPGNGAHEYAFAGGVWRFRNPGNRAAFIIEPSTYMPKFGGYDPIAVARDVTVPGNPRLWHVVDGALYLFHTVEALSAFTLDADRIIATADRKWPSLRQHLTL